MSKLVILLLIVLAYKSTAVQLDDWDRDVKELDDLVFRRYSRHGGDYRFPETFRAVYKEYCSNFISETVHANKLVQKIFSDNTVLLIIYKLGQMDRVNLWHMFCNEKDLIQLVARFNHKLNPYMSSIIPWHWSTVNTFLVAAEPNSEITPGQLICLAKKLALDFLDSLPRNLARHFAKYIDYYNSVKGTQVLELLSYLKVDINETNCEIPTRKARNPLNLKSKTVAFLLAWDSVLRKTLDNLAQHKGYR